MELESIIIVGFVASIIHVISGPDHLAAVTPLAIETKRKVSFIGFFWGVGHIVGMLIIGLLFLLFKKAIPIEAISEYSEQIVAFVLIGVGLWSLYNLFYKKSVGSQSDSNYDSNQGKYLAKEQPRLAQNFVKKNIVSSFSIGFLHGLAGIAHFLLLIPALGFNSYIESSQYIFGFAIGTVFAMTVYTVLLGTIAKVSSNNSTVLKGFRFVGGVFALAIGVYWLF